MNSYLLVSDCHIFFEYIRENDLSQKLIEKCRHPFLGFAEVLLRRGCEKVLVGQVENNEVVGNIVIYIEKYGLGMTVKPNDSWGVAIFDYYPLKEIGATAEIVIGDESDDFFDDELYIKYEDAVKSKITSIGINFQTQKI